MTAALAVEAAISTTEPYATREGRRQPAHDAGSYYDQTVGYDPPTVQRRHEAKQERGDKIGGKYVERETVDRILHHQHDVFTCRRAERPANDTPLSRD